MITKFKTNAEVIENGDKYLYGNHVRIPLALEGGDGSWVIDKDGNRYLDFIGGIAVNGLGHNHPRIQECLAERAQSILHCSNYFYNEPAVQTAKMIVENSCFEKVLYANSGAEANELLYSKIDHCFDIFFGGHVSLFEEASPLILRIDFICALLTFFV